MKKIESDIQAWRQETRAHTRKDNTQVPTGLQGNALRQRISAATRGLTDAEKRHVMKSVNLAGSPKGMNRYLNERYSERISTHLITRF